MWCAPGGASRVKYRRVVSHCLRLCGSSCALCPRNRHRQKWWRGRGLRLAYLVSALSGGIIRNGFRAISMREPGAALGASAKLNRLQALLDISDDSLYLIYREATQRLAPYVAKRTRFKERGSHRFIGALHD